MRALGSHHVIRNGPVEDDQRLPQTLNVGFVGLDGDSLLMQLDLIGIAASLARLAQRVHTSFANLAGHGSVPDAYLRSSVRFSFGASTTAAEIIEESGRIVEVVQHIKVSKTTA